MNNIRYTAPGNQLYDTKLSQLYFEQTLDKPVKTVTLQVTEDCCMACTYCYQHNKSKNKMNFETAKKFIDDLSKYEEFDIGSKCR